MRWGILPRWAFCHHCVIPHFFQNLFSRSAFRPLFMNFNFHLKKSGGSPNTSAPDPKGEKRYWGGLKQLEKRI
jgi:hypothetical protein